MSQYKDFLNQIEIPDVDTNATDKITLDDLMLIHPSLTPESVELWGMFYTLRPDLSEEEKADIRAIINKLKQRESNNFAAIMRDMKRRQSERPAEIGDNQCVITPLDIEA
jgi:hypothetical protein